MSTLQNVMSHREPSGWETLTIDSDEDAFHERIRAILRSTPTPWRDIDRIPMRTVEPTVQQSVMNALQEELDAPDSSPEHWKVCFKCLRALSNASDIYPDSLVIDKAIVFSQYPESGRFVEVGNGGSADVYKGIMDGKQVCIKAFRTIGMTRGEQRTFLKTMCRETIAWKQLRHNNILPFIGVDTQSYPGKLSLISPCMENGNIRLYLDQCPDADRVECIREITAAIEFIHSFEPKIIHGNIHGNNIIVNDEGHCCLTDFGASIIVATNVSSNDTMGRNAVPWLCPELLVYDPTTYVNDSLPSRDVYAFGCTIIEIYTQKVPFSHVPYYHMTSAKIRGIDHPRPPEIVSDRLWKLVQQCMAYEPGDRPNAADVQASLAEM